MVSPYDAAHPGTLPQLESGAVAAAIRAGLFLHCEINPASRFDRKHYFYPDLPAGYQITQKYTPLGTAGYVDLLHDEGHLTSTEPEVRVEIEQLQLEQDTAKSSHSASGTSNLPSHVFLDLNRSGAGLMEIVSGPQMRSPEQAGAYIRKIQELLRRTGSSDGNMDEGSLRCDVNVSVHRIGEPFGTRCEVKNVNSIRFVMNAISFEMQRQYHLLSRGENVEQQTRGYDEDVGETFFLRSKEDAPDYRYMPDPNLPPLLISAETLAGFQKGLPEHPDKQRRRLKEQYGLNTRDVNVLMRVGLEETFADLTTASEGARAADAVAYFEDVAKGRNPQVAVNWVIHELLKAFNRIEAPFDSRRVPARSLGELIDLVEAGKVTGTSAKKLLAELVVEAHEKSDAASSSSTSILELLKEKNLLAMDSSSTSSSEVETLCQQIISDLPKEAEKVRQGNEKVVMRLVGEAMKRTGGRADAKKAREIFVKMLTSL